MSKENDGFNKVTIEAAKTGWILKEAGRPAEIFVRWDYLVSRLEDRLTNKNSK